MSNTIPKSNGIHLSRNQGNAIINYVNNRDIEPIYEKAGYIGANVYGFGMAGWGRRVAYHIPANGKYVDSITLVLVFNDQSNEGRETIFKWVKELQICDLFEQVELVIGGNEIEKVFGKSIDILQKLYGLTTRYVMMDTATHVYIELPFGILMENNMMPMHVYLETGLNLRLPDVKDLETKYCVPQLSDAYFRVTYDNQLNNRKHLIKLTDTIPVIHYTGSESIYLETNKMCKYKMCTMGHAKLYFLFVTNPAGDRVPCEDLFEMVQLIINNRDIVNSPSINNIKNLDLADLFNASRRILDVPDVLCIPLAPIKSFEAGIMKRYNQIRDVSKDDIFLNIKFKELEEKKIGHLEGWKLEVFCATTLNLQELLQEEATKMKRDIEDFIKIY